MSSEELLLVFVKNSQKGGVKTRLADAVGDDKAMQIYQKLLRYTRDILSSLKTDVQVWYSQYIPLNDMWDQIGAEKRTQHGTNLGDRMKHAFERAFAEGYHRVVIIGSDCAELTTNTIRRAFEELHEHNTVIGPSQDGGYYLLGMDQFVEEIFEDKAWSTNAVFSETVEEIEDLGLSCYRLPELNDVDTIDDWEEVKFRFADSTT